MVFTDHSLNRKGVLQVYYNGIPVLLGLWKMKFDIFWDKDGENHSDILLKQFM